MDKILIQGHHFSNAIFSNEIFLVPPENIRIVHSNPVTVDLHVDLRAPDKSVFLD